MTGGTSGIGRSTAIAFARDGARVVVSGRREKEGGETVALLKKAGGEGIFVKTDVTNEAEVAALVWRTVETYGRLDVAFNNAGTEGALGLITEATVENYTHVFDANVKGVLFSMKHEVPALLKNPSDESMYLFSVGQASLPAGSGGILPPMEHSGQGCPENWQPGWLPYMCPKTLNRYEPLAEVSRQEPLAGGRGGTL